MKHFSQLETKSLPAGRRVSFRPAVASIAALRAERERLEEEVKQLRAAAQIYSEIVRRTAARCQSSTAAASAAA